MVLKWWWEPTGTVRALLKCLQVVGSCTFSWSGSSRPTEPRFSLWLLLWSIFTHVVVLSGYCDEFSLIITLFSTYVEDVGGVVNYSMHQVGALSLILCYCLVMCRGRLLVQLFCDLDMMFTRDGSSKEETKTSKSFVTFRGLLYTSSFIYWSSGNIYIVLCYDSSATVRKIFKCFWVTIAFFSCILILLFYNAVFQVLGVFIRQSTEEALQEDSHQHPTKSTRFCIVEESPKLLKLFDLERRIWQVSNHRIY